MLVWTPALKNTCYKYLWLLCAYEKTWTKRSLGYAASKVPSKGDKACLSVLLTHLPALQRAVLLLWDLLNKLQTHSQARERCGSSTAVCLYRSWNHLFGFPASKAAQQSRQGWAEGRRAGDLSCSQQCVLKDSQHKAWIHWNNSKTHYFSSSLLSPAWGHSINPSLRVSQRSVPSWMWNSLCAWGETGKWMWHWEWLWLLCPLDLSEPNDFITRACHKNKSCSARSVFTV